MACALSKGACCGEWRGRSNVAAVVVRLQRCDSVRSDAAVSGRQTRFSRYMFEFLAWVQVFGLDLSLSVVYDRSGSNSGKIGMDWLVHVHTW